VERGFAEPWSVLVKQCTQDSTDQPSSDKAGLLQDPEESSTAAENEHGTRSCRSSACRMICEVMPSRRHRQTALTWMLAQIGRSRGPS
jgi:hypothetical protein